MSIAIAVLCLIQCVLSVIRLKGLSDLQTKMQIHEQRLELHRDIAQSDDKWQSDLSKKFLSLDSEIFSLKSRWDENISFKNYVVEKLQNRMPIDSTLVQFDARLQVFADALADKNIDIDNLRLEIEMLKHSKN